MVVKIDYQQRYSRRLLAQPLSPFTHCLLVALQQLPWDDGNKLHCLSALCERQRGSCPDLPSCAGAFTVTKSFRLKGLSSFSSPSVVRNHHPDTTGVLSHLLFKKKTFLAYWGLWGNHINSILLKWYISIIMECEWGRILPCTSIRLWWPRIEKEHKMDVSVCVCVRGSIATCIPQQGQNEHFVLNYFLHF